MTDRRPTEIESAALLARVLEQMAEAGRPLFLHEFDCLRLGCSANNLATRVSEWARQGLVLGRWKDGMKAWQPGTGVPVVRAPDRLNAKVQAITEAPLLGGQIVTIFLPTMAQLPKNLSVRIPRTA